MRVVLELGVRGKTASVCAGFWILEYERRIPLTFGLLFLPLLLKMSRECLPVITPRLEILVLESFCKSVLASRARLSAGNLASVQILKRRVCCLGLETTWNQSTWREKYQFEFNSEDGLRF